MLKDEDIIIISVVDINYLEMDFYYYNLNTKFINEKWILPKILTYKKYEQVSQTSSCNDIRKNDAIKLENGGWHLSYFGSSEFIKNKIENFSHQELNNNTNTNLDIIQERITKSVDIFDRHWIKNISKIEIKDNVCLPPEYEKYLHKFYTQ